eukprot:scaffold209828_cov23-Tisochrysis_lutea.AAC.2
MAANTRELEARVLGLSTLCGSGSGRAKLVTSGSNCEMACLNSSTSSGSGPTSTLYRNIKSKSPL